MADNYGINYDDPRFEEVNKEMDTTIKENENLYNGMIEGSDKIYQDQINASKDWADTQNKLQQEQTDFAIDKVEQQKQQAEKDYQKQQSGAYVDWQKQSNNYGVNAEQQAYNGLRNGGYAESSQVNMWNTYQNRVATARESYNKALVDYNNAITQARLQNNAQLAQIAYEALQQQLTLSLQSFQYKNQLLLEQANKKLEINNLYYNRQQDIINQINTENAMAEQVRQFNYKNGLGEFAPAPSSGGGGGGWDYVPNTTPDVEPNVVPPNAPKITANDVLNLGQGPLSAEKAGEMLANGEVAFDNNGKLTLTSTGANKGSSANMFAQNLLNNNKANTTASTGTTNKNSTVPTFNQMVSPGVVKAPATSTTTKVTPEMKEALKKMYGANAY